MDSYKLNADLNKARNMHAKKILWDTMFASLE